MSAYLCQVLLDGRYIYTFWVGVWASRRSMRRRYGLTPNMEAERQNSLDFFLNCLQEGKYGFKDCAVG